MAEPLNATFYALRNRGKSGVLTSAAIACVIGMLVLVGAFFALNISTLGPFITWYISILQATASGNTSSIGAMDPPAGLPLFFASLLPFMILVYILVAAFEAACLRWLIRGESGGGLMGLTLGADTWRVYSIYWVWFAANLVYSLASGIVSALIIGIVAVSSSGEESAVLWATGITYLITYVVMAYLAVRFAPAAAVSVGRQKFNFFKAWTVTRGRFWPLLGAFVLLFVLGSFAQIFLVIVFTIAFFGSLIPTMVNMGQGGSDAMSSVLGALFAPENLAILGALYVLLVIISMALYIALYGVNARAVVAAAEEGKIDGVVSPGMARTFE